MLELKKLNVFANDREKPTIILTYILKEEKGKKREVDLIKLWIRKDVVDRGDYETINYANQFYYHVIHYNLGKNIIKEKDIFQAYQMLFSDKLFENYQLLHDIIFDKVAITYAPQKDYIEFYEDFMKDFVLETIVNDTKNKNKRGKS